MQYSFKCVKTIRGEMSLIPNNCPVPPNENSCFYKKPNTISFKIIKQRTKFGKELLRKEEIFGFFNGE